MLELVISHTTVIIKSNLVVIHTITHAYSTISSIGIVLKYIHTHLDTCKACVAGFHTKTTYCLLVFEEENLSPWKIITWTKN